MYADSIASLAKPGRPAAEIGPKHRPRGRQEGDPSLSFLEAIAAAGFPPPRSIIADGRIHRFATNGRRGDDAGWYVLFPDGVPSGAFGCFRAGASHTWCARDRRELSRAERAEFRRRIASARTERKEAEAEMRQECRRRAEALWNGVDQVDPAHPYLARKRVQAHGIGQSRDRLVIPVRDADGVLHGLQFIAPDGGKLFLLGTAKRGCFHLIGEPAAELVIAEGYATAASIHEATGLAVAVAFDAGNLRPAGEALRRKLPSARFTFAADNDEHGVGEARARDAAEAVGGRVLVPAELNDWNDVAVAHGPEAVNAEFMAPSAETKPVLIVPPGFAMRSSGLSWQDTADPEKPPLLLAAPFEVVAETRDADGSSWGVLLHWRDHDGREHEWAMPRAMLASDGAEVRKALLDGGLYVAPGRKARDLLNTYLGSIKISARARAVTRTGWHGTVYVLPDATLGSTNGERILLQTTGAVDHAFRIAGTLEDWQEKVAALAAGNSRLVLALSSALAAPLVEIAGAESGGFHFRGASSIGKTTLLKAAGSAWGGGDVVGYTRSWRATANGLEGIAAGHCDGLLCLDEIGQVAPREAGEVAYMLANGSGKARAARDGAARRAARWRLLFLSTGEISLADKVAEDGRGRRAAAGQQVRVVDIPADAGKGCGLFEDLHGFPSAEAFARHLTAASGAHYGTAARVFIEAVAQDVERVRQAVTGFARDFVAEHTPRGADGQVTRVAQRFALIAGAGELASRLGVLPWRQGEASAGTVRCFRDWLEARGGIEAAEIRDGIAQIRRFIEAHGESRFSPWTLASTSDNPRPTTNRVGFRRSNSVGETEWFVLPEAWRSELCAGFDPGALARALVERGLLIPDSDGKPQSRHRLPEANGPVRCYRLASKILGDGDA